MTSSMIRKHLDRLLALQTREDGRGLLEYRKDITVELGISTKSAEGSARVKIGRTEVVAGVKLCVDKPYPDTPEQGNLVVSVELLPLSSPDFESGPPNIEAIELSRIVDRCIRETECIDLEKLCIKKKEKVWTVFIDIYPINDDGNLFDAAALAAIAALQDARLPDYDAKEEKVVYESRTKTKLPLQHIPMEITVVKIANQLLIDPTLNEWTCLDARLTVAVLEDGTICGMQKGGEAGLTVDEVNRMIEIALTKAGELRSRLFKG